MNVSLTNAVYKTKISVMLICVPMYSKIPQMQMMSFSLWFPVSLLSRELSVAFALCTQCCADFVHRQLMGASQQKRPGCSALVSIHPQAASRRFYQQQLDTLPQDQWLKEWITSFLVTPTNGNQEGFLRGIFFMVYCGNTWLGDHLWKQWYYCSGWQKAMGTVRFPAK